MPLHSLALRGGKGIFVREYVFVGVRIRHVDICVPFKLVCVSTGLGLLGIGVRSSLDLHFSIKQYF